MEHKSERLKQTALSFNWKAEVVPKLHRYEKSGDASDIEWHVYAMRDKETIHVLYMGNRFISSKYTYGGTYCQYPARTGGVIKLLAGKPDPRRLSGDPGELIESRVVPWDDDTPALDIMLAVLGRTVTWIRQIDGEVCSAYIEKSTNVGKQYFRLTQSKAGRRILEWQDRQGFHSVGLERIIDVS